MHYLVPLILAGGVFFILGPTLAVLSLFFFLLFVAIFWLVLRGFAKGATFYKALGISNWAGVCVLAVFVLLALGLREAVVSNPKVLKYVFWNASSVQELKTVLWIYGTIWTLFCLWMWVFFSGFYVEKPLMLRIAACVIAFALNYACAYVIGYLTPDSIQRKLAKRVAHEIVEIHGERWAKEIGKSVGKGLVLPSQFP